MRCELQSSKNCVKCKVFFKSEVHWWTTLGLVGGRNENLKSMFKNFLKALKNASNFSNFKRVNIEFCALIFPLLRKIMYRHFLKADNHLLTVYWNHWFSCVCQWLLKALIILEIFLFFSNVCLFQRNIFIFRRPPRESPFEDDLTRKSSCEWLILFYFLISMPGRVHVIMNSNSIWSIYMIGLSRAKIVLVARFRYGVGIL